MMKFSLDFAHAYPLLGITARFRQQVDDFEVTEIMPENCFSGDGEHHCFLIEKRGENTAWVAKILAEQFAVDEVAVGYCGLKDRHAVTRQWFSVNLPGMQSVSLPNLGETIQVLDYQRHHKKLRRGEHLGNQFRIRLRGLTSDNAANSFEAQLEHRLEKIQETGVPNYFGEQRFGREGNNLLEAERLLSQIGERNSSGSSQKKPNRRNKRGRSRAFSGKQGMYLSAARAYLFNTVLSERIKQCNWSMMSADETGPLWGRGRNPVEPEFAELEYKILEPFSDWLNSMEFSGLNQERRKLVLNPTHFTWNYSEGDLILAFDLQSGEYATSVLRELVFLEHIR